MENYVFYVANTQKDNLGDLIINYLLLRELEKTSKIVLNVRSCDVDYVKILNTISADKVVDSNFIFFLKIIMRCRINKVFFYLKPGHYYGYNGGYLKQLSLLVGFVIMRFFGVKICRLGASIGPFSSCCGFVERLQSILYDRFTVRESYSLQYCKSIGVKNVIYCPDMAFLLDVEGDSMHKKNKAIYSFRRKTLSHDNQDVDVLKFLKSATDYFGEDRVEFITQVKSDFEYNSELRNNLGLKTSHLVYRDDPLIFLNLYSNYEYVLSNRLHVLLFAASKNVIPIPIIDGSRHVKIAGVFKQIGLEFLIFDVLGDFQIKNHIKRVEIKKDKIRLDMCKAFKEQKKVLLNYLYS